MIKFHYQQRKAPWNNGEEQNLPKNGDRLMILKSPATAWQAQKGEGEGGGRKVQKRGKGKGVPAIH